MAIANLFSYFGLDLQLTPERNVSMKLFFRLLEIGQLKH